MRNPEIEKLIRRAPSDDRGYMVYGDWLQEHGDPRGELVVLQHRLQADPDNPQLRAAEAEIINRKRHEIFGPLSEHLGSFAGTWRLGFLRELHIHGGHSMDGKDKAEDVISQLLSHECSAFLQSLSLGAFPATTRRGTQNKLLKHVLSHPLPTLRTLFVFDDVNSRDLKANLSATANKSMPNLERLVLYGQKVRLGGVKLGRLQALSLHGGEALAQNIDRAVDGRFPKLSELTIWGDEDGNATEALDRLLKGGFSGLSCLRLRNVQDTDFVSKLLTSPLAGQLETLELSMGTLDEQGAQELKKSSSLSNLRTLYLGGNSISALDRNTLTRKFPFACMSSTAETDSGFGRLDLQMYYSYLEMRANELEHKSTQAQARFALSECVGSSMALYNLGTDVMATRPELSITLLREAQHHPERRTYSPSYGNLCGCYALTNDFDSIIEIARRGIACFPQDPNLHSFLVDALRQTDLTRALVAARLAARVVCDSVTGRFLLVDIIITLLMGGQAQAAVDTYEESQSNPRPSVVPYYGTNAHIVEKLKVCAALAYIHVGDTKQAELLRSDVELPRPEDDFHCGCDHKGTGIRPVYHHLQACILATQGESEAALAAMKQASNLGYSEIRFMETDTLLAPLIKGPGA